MAFGQGVKNYVLESVDELKNKTSWPTWNELQSSAIVVLIATFIIALIVYLMDVAFGQSMGLIYDAIHGGGGTTPTN